MIQPPPTSSVVDLVTNALQRITNLVRGELELARAEAIQSARSAATGLALILVAAITAICAINVAAAAIVAALAESGLSPALSAAIVTAVFAVLAIVFAMAGIKALKSTADAPRRVAKNLRRDAHIVQEVISNDTQH